MTILENPAAVAQGLQQFLAAMSAARYAAGRVRLPTPNPVNTYHKKDA
jgi:hypothetical protein